MNRHGHNSLRLSLGAGRNSDIQDGSMSSPSTWQNFRSSPMRKEVEIVNRLGLHARPAAQFVRWAMRFKSTITIWKGEEMFSASSLLEVLTANLDCGARVVLEAVGPDEQQAIGELEELLRRFRDQEA
jgi:phosphocarrier protein HPr